MAPIDAILIGTVRERMVSSSRAGSVATPPDKPSCQIVTPVAMQSAAVPGTGTVDRDASRHTKQSRRAAGKCTRAGSKPNTTMEER
jgi:hypothetical protein